MTRVERRTEQADGCSVRRLVRDCLHAVEFDRAGSGADELVDAVAQFDGAVDDDLDLALSVGNPINAGSR